MNHCAKANSLKVVSRLRVAVLVWPSPPLWVPSCVRDGPVTRQLRILGVGSQKKAHKKKSHEVSDNG